MKKITFALMFFLALISFLYSIAAGIFILYSAFLAYREGSLFRNGGTLLSWIVVLAIGYALLRGICWLITWVWVTLFERPPSRTDESAYDLLITKPTIGKGGARR